MTIKRIAPIDFTSLYVLVVVCNCNQYNNNNNKLLKYYNTNKPYFIILYNNIAIVLQL